MKYRLLFLMPLIALTSCSSAKFAVTGKTYPKHEGTVSVFNKPPDSLKYEEIGIVTSTGGGIIQLAE